MINPLSQKFAAVIIVIIENVSIASMVSVHNYEMCY